MSSVLIHIGYPKAGSSYLQAWFEKHPSFYYKTNLVAGFSNLLEMAEYAQKTAKVHDCFVVSSEDLVMWKGDVNIVGLKYQPYDIEDYQTKLCATLNRIFPAAKVLIVTRGFESFIKSIYSEMLLAGSTLTFEKFQTEYAKFLSRFCNYSRVINLYREKFGNDNVILLPFELLKNNPSTFTSLIEEKMGFEYRFKFPSEKVNPSLPYPLQAAYVSASNLVHNIISPFPYSIQKKIYGFYLYQLNKRKPHPVMMFYSKMLNRKGELQVKAETLQLFAGKAEVLRNEKLFEPFLKEYLL